MDQMKRFAIYYAPRDGAFADAAAGWLGWDARTGQAVAQPEVPGLAAMTADPRRYGFHATIKPPFRLRDGSSAKDLAQILQTHAALLPRIALDGLKMVRLDGFLALIPVGDAAPLRAMAAQVSTAANRLDARRTVRLKTSVSSMTCGSPRIQNSPAT